MIEEQRPERRRNKQIDMNSELMVELDLNGGMEESKLEIKPKSGLYDELTNRQL